MPLIRRTLFALGGALAAAGCSPVQILNSFAPSRLAADGVAYGDGPRQVLDVYVPAGAGPFPVVMFLYGGGWTSGDRAMYRFVGGALAEKGFVTVIPDYRLFPEVRFPAFLQDNAAALRWTRDTVGRYGGAAGPIFLIGHSAGAYDAAMLALDPQWLAGVGLDHRADLRGTVGLAGPYDFLPLNTDELREIFGPADQLARTQPINFVDGTAAPMLLLAGNKDTTVDPGNTLRLAARIQQTGGVVQDRLYPGIQHEEIVGAIGVPLRFLAPTLRDCVAFMGGPQA